MKKAYNITLCYNRLAGLFKFLFKTNQSEGKEQKEKNKKAAEHRFAKPTSFKIIMSENSGEIYKLVENGMNENEAFKHLKVSLTLHSVL